MCDLDQQRGQTEQQTLQRAYFLQVPSLFANYLGTKPDVPSEKQPW